MTYAEKLKDPRWQKKRLEILQRDEWHCKCCGDNKETLHIHHLHYTGKNPWDIPNEFLMTLCATCHERETKDRKEAEENLLEQLRYKGFLCDSLEIIAEGINKFNPVDMHAFTTDAEVISYALSEIKFAELFCEFMDNQTIKK